VHGVAPTGMTTRRGLKVYQFLMREKTVQDYAKKMLGYLVKLVLMSFGIIFWRTESGSIIMLIFWAD
jgi:hypothetical protein